MRRLVVLLIVIYSVTACCSAQQKQIDWVGTYGAYDNLGEKAKATEHSSIPYYEYELTIKKGTKNTEYDCLLFIHGYMMLSEIQAVGFAKDSTITINFVKCLDGMEFGMTPKTGTILKLVKRGDKIVTLNALFHDKETWNNREPEFLPK